MNKETLAQKKEEINKKFKEIEEGKRSLEEKIISFSQEMLRLQGEYRLVEEFEKNILLSEEDKKEEVF